MILSPLALVLPHFGDWNVLELRSRRKPDAAFFKAFSEQVYRSYNLKKKHNETSLRPGTQRATVNGESAAVSGNSPNPNLLCLSLSAREAQTITIKINERIYAADEVKIEVRRGETKFTGFVIIPNEHDNSCGVEVEASLAQALNLNLNIPVSRGSNEDDPIDRMIQVRSRNTIPALRWIMANIALNILQEIPRI
jgi:hypothetical protein